MKTKPASKPEVKSSKPSLTKEQISQIARQAALKAHCSDTFQKKFKLSPADMKERRANYNNALKTAPAFIRERFDRL